MEKLGDSAVPVFPSAAALRLAPGARPSLLLVAFRRRCALPRLPCARFPLLATAAPALSSCGEGSWFPATSQASCQICFPRLRLPRYPVSPMFCNPLHCSLSTPFLFLWLSLTASSVTPTWIPTTHPCRFPRRRTPSHLIRMLHHPPPHSNPSPSKVATSASRQHVAALAALLVFA